jgi:hypothetical protein
MTEAAAVIARGIDKPDLRYEQFPYDQVEQVLTQMGVPPKGAALYIEMYKAINAGVLIPQEPRSPENTTPTSSLPVFDRWSMHWKMDLASGRFSTWL